MYRRGASPKASINLYLGSPISDDDLQVERLRECRIREDMCIDRVSMKC